MFKLCILGFLRFSLESRCSFGLGFVQRSHKPLNCWGYESKTPIGGKQTWNHQIIWFYEELVDLR